jgi:hypothetical protein
MQVKPQTRVSCGCCVGWLDGDCNLYRALLGIYPTVPFQHFALFLLPLLAGVIAVVGLLTWNPG